MTFEEYRIKLSRKNIKKYGNSSNYSDMTEIPRGNLGPVRSLELATLTIGSIRVCDTFDY